MGRARRRHRHRRTVTPSSATACRPPARPAAGDDRRGGAGGDRSCCSARTSRRSCRSCTCGCATPPSSAQARSSSSRPVDTGPHAATPGAASASRPARRSRRRSAPSPTTRSPTSSRAGPVVVVAGRANLAESTAPRSPRCRRVLDACPGATVLPAAAPGQRRRRASSSGSRRSDGGLDAAGILQRRRRRAHRPARAARRRPARRLSPTPTSPAAPSPAPAGSSPSTRSSPTRRAAPTSCSPPPRSARSPARRRTSRAASRTSAQKVTVAGTARPDWMIAVRARRAARPRRRRRHADVARRDHRRHRRDGAGVRRGDPRRRCAPSPTACSPCPPRAAAFDAGDCAARPTASATTIGWCSSRKLYDRAVGDGAFAVARPAGAAGRGARPPARPRRHRRRRRHRGAASSRRRAPSCCRSRPTSRVPRGSLLVPFNVRARRSPTSSTPRAPANDVRVERLCECSALDPLLDGALLWTPLLIVLLKVARDLRHRPRRHDVHGLVRAQDHRRHAEPGRARTRPARSGSCRRSPTA